MTETEKKTGLYLIDDGALNWVVATTKARAKQVMYSDLGTSKYDHEINSIRRLRKAEAMRQELYDDGRKVLRSMWEEFERDKSERYVACSEW